MQVKGVLFPSPFAHLEAKSRSNIWAFYSSAPRRVEFCRFLLSTGNSNIHTLWSIKRGERTLLIDSSLANCKATARRRTVLHSLLDFLFRRLLQASILVIVSLRLPTATLKSSKTLACGIDALPARLELLPVAMADTDFHTRNYGPLTTVFTPPSSCHGIRIQLMPVDKNRPQPDSSAVTSGSTIQRFAWGDGCDATYTNSSWKVSPTQDISCFPSTPKSAQATGHAMFTLGVYSPGLVCPSGWIADCAVAYTSNPPPFSESPALNRLWYVLKPGETFVGCCPP